MKRLPAFFYELPSGRVPVREWIRALDAEDRKTIGEDIKDVEFSWPIGMPMVRPLGHGLWEVRSNLTHGRIGRVLSAFTVAGWCCCTVSSRSNRRLRKPTWIWP